MSAFFSWSRPLQPHRAQDLVADPLGVVPLIALADLFVPLEFSGVLRGADAAGITAGFVQVVIPCQFFYPPHDFPIVFHVVEGRVIKHQVIAGRKVSELKALRHGAAVVLRYPKAVKILPLAVCAHPARCVGCDHRVRAVPHAFCSAAHPVAVVIAPEISVPFGAGLPNTDVFVGGDITLFLPGLRAVPLCSYRQLLFAMDTSRNIARGETRPYSW